MTARFARFSDWLYYFGALPLAAAAPRVLRRRLIGALFRHILRVQPVPREAAIHHIQNVLGVDLTAAQRINRRSFELMVADDVDGFLMPFWRRGNLRRHFEIEGQGHLREALSRGKGAIVMTGHFGAACSMVAALGLLGFPIRPLTHDSRTDAGFNSALRRYSTWKLTWLSRKLGAKPIFVDLKGNPAGRASGSLEVLATLRAGGLVSIPLDVPRPAGTRPATLEATRFLGRCCRFPTGILDFAKWSGAAIVPCFVLREGLDRQRVMVQPRIDLSGDRERDLRSCARRLEEMVRQHPAHWFAWDSWSLFEVDPTESTSDRNSDAPAPAVASTCSKG